MTSVTMEHFHEDVEAAEKASSLGPVIITQDGAAKRVLIDIDEYRRILHLRKVEGTASPADRDQLKRVSETDTPSAPDQLRDTIHPLAVPEDEYFDWEPERLYFTAKPTDIG